MFSKKKILLPLASIVSITAPSIAVISCGKDDYTPRIFDVDIEDIVDNLKADGQFFGGLEVSKQLGSEINEKLKNATFTFNITKAGTWNFSGTHFNINKKIVAGPFVLKYDWSKQNEDKSDAIGVQYKNQKGTWNIKYLEKGRDDDGNPTGKPTLGYEYFEHVVSSLAYRIMSINSRNEVGGIILNKIMTEREIASVSNDNDLAIPQNKIRAYTSFLDNLKAVMAVNIQNIQKDIDDLSAETKKLQDPNLTSADRIIIQGKIKTINDRQVAQDESNDKNEFAKSLLRIFMRDWPVFDAATWTKLKTDFSRLVSPSSEQNITELLSTLQSYFAMPKMVEPVYRLILISSLLDLHHDIDVDHSKNLSESYVKTFLERMGYKVHNLNEFGTSHKFDESINGIQYCEEQADGTFKRTTKVNNSVILKVASQFTKPIW